MPSAAFVQCATLMLAATHAAAAPPSTAAAEASEPVASRPADAEALQAMSDRVAGEVATLRGLPLLRPVERRVEARAASGPALSR